MKIIISIIALLSIMPFISAELNNNNIWSYWSNQLNENCYLRTQLSIPCLQLNEDNFAQYGMGAEFENAYLKNILNKRLAYFNWINSHHGSSSPNPEPKPEIKIVTFGDITGDNKVNQLDVIRIQKDWGKSEGDLTGDNLIDDSDLSIVLSNQDGSTPTDEELSIELSR